MKLEASPFSFHSYHFQIASDIHVTLLINKLTVRGQGTGLFSQPFCSIFVILIYCYIQQISPHLYWSVPLQSAQMCRSDDWGLKEKRPTWFYTWSAWSIKQNTQGLEWVPMLHLPSQVNFCLLLCLVVEEIESRKLILTRTAERVATSQKHSRLLR